MLNDNQVYNYIISAWRHDLQFAQAWFQTGLKKSKCVD